MNRNKLYEPNNYDRKIVKIDITRKQQLVTLPSTAIHSKETKRKANTSTSLLPANEPTKKYVPVFNSYQLDTNDCAIPNSILLMNQLKNLEKQFKTKSNNYSLTLYALCRLRFIRRLKQARVGFGLTDETIFLAVHLYDKYFELECRWIELLSDSWFNKEVFDINRFVKSDGSLISNHVRS